MIEITSDEKRGGVLTVGDASREGEKESCEGGEKVDIGAGGW
jgi:hypothetical protein